MQYLYQSMATFLNLSMFVTLLNIPTLLSTELVEFGFQTNGGSANQDNLPVIVTLWFDDKIYQTSLEPISLFTWYVGHKDNAPKFTLLGLSDCTPNNDGETKMMVESNTFDTLKMKQLKIQTDSVWYGVETVMIYGQEIGEPCLSTDSTDCKTAQTGGIYKQMFYFDTTNQNQFITKAQWSNAMDIYPEHEVQTCDPTHAPSTDPTRFPTINPTSSPTLIPTQFPSLVPTQSPTFIPTQSPTLIPTMNPAPSPTMIPSGSITSTQVLLSTSATMTVYVDEQSEDTSNRQVGSVTNLMWPYGVIFIVIAVCFSVLLLLYCCRYETHKRRKKETVQKEEHDHNDWIQLWLEQAVLLPQYVDNFVQNGYSNVDTVGSITDKQQLVEIGIYKKGHQTLLMSEIEKLKRVNKKGRPDAVIPVRVVEHPKANEELLEGNTEERPPAMIVVQSLSHTGATTGKVFVDEDDSNREMDQHDDIMHDICIDDRGNTNDGLKNDEFIVEDDDPCTLPTVM